MVAPRKDRTVVFLFNSRVLTFLRIEEPTNKVDCLIIFVGYRDTCLQNGDMALARFFCDKAKSPFCITVPR